MVEEDIIKIGLEDYVPTKEDKELSEIIQGILAENKKTYAKKFNKLDKQLIKAKEKYGHATSLILDGKTNSFIRYTKVYYEMKSIMANKLIPQAKRILYGRHRN
jgi:hypothetical protein